MAKRFKNKKIDLTIEVESEDGKEVKTFTPVGKVTAAYADEVGVIIRDYIKEQQAKPEDEQDRIIPGTIKQLQIIYPDMEMDWMMQNTSGKEEIMDIYTWVMGQLTGVKKGSKN